MTVDESPVSPPHHTQTKSKNVQTAPSVATVASTSLQSGSVNNDIAASPAARLSQGSPRPITAESHTGHASIGGGRGGLQQAQSLHRSNSPASNIPSRVHNNETMCAPRSPITFENYVQGNPSKAKEILEQLTEVTGVRDTTILHKAFNQTRKGDQFNVTLAIEWILNLPPQINQTPLMPDLAPITDTKRGPLTIATTTASGVPMQPPNSPNSNPVVEVAGQPNRNLVDLTDSVSSTQNKSSSGGTATNEEADLEKAIQLSLQEANARNSGGAHAASSHGPPGMSQEDQDVSRALEASLAYFSEQTGAYGKRRKDGSWADPLNPHDRERNGIWPVGLKNVGQTCWFSAVMQSLFYLPAFRTLVLNYRPSISTAYLSDDKNSSDKCPPMESGQSTCTDDSRNKKIVEFMVELQKLFALLVASQRKYVDPTRAVDILRASFGGTANIVENEIRNAATNSNTTNSADQGAGNNGVGSTAVCANTNGNKSAINSLGNAPAQNSNVLIMDNNQQDVSEFTHIVLEWVEEAFKKPNSTTLNATVISSLENKEELMEEGSIGADCMPHADAGDEKENNEEKTNVEDEDEDISEKDHSPIVFTTNEEMLFSDTKNPMTELFYGQVLTEGSIQGEEFIRSEAFGQWPLQVNTYKDIHETLENSTAHEYFDQAATSSQSGSASNPVSSLLSSSNAASVQDVPSSGQERWFTKLPPVLVLELSRFHFNTERKAAEKIHNRLDFSEKIYMDRYMHRNKIITRRKRDEVRRLKEKRAHLKARLERYTKYRGAHTEPDNVDNPKNDSHSITATNDNATNTTLLPLPEILQYALDFANSREGRVNSSALSSNITARACDVSMNSPSNDAHSVSNPSGHPPPAGPIQHLHQQSAMQIDSPCGSPKVTPASSVSNLNNAQGKPKQCIIHIECTSIFSYYLF